MFTRYNRRLHEQVRQGSVETLRNVVNLEAEYAIRPNEAIHGLGHESV